MRFTKPVLHGFGYALAPVIVPTEELEEQLLPVYRRLHIDAGQIERLTGIVERRWWEPGYPVSEGAVVAAKRALNQAGVCAQDIEMLVYGAVCREHYEPATACHVAAGLARAGHEISRTAAVYDVSNACLGVLTGILDVASRIELGHIRAGMVVACETAREINELAIARLLDDPTLSRFSSSVATFTGGSGAVAVIMTDGSFGDADRRRLLGAAMESAPEHHRLCRWGVEPHPQATAPSWDPALRPFASTDSAAVLTHGVALGESTWARFLETMDWNAGEVDRTVCHQIGAAHRTMMLDKLGISPAQDFAAYEQLGNMGSVALPFAAALADERDFLTEGQRVALLGIGSGLNCLMLGVQW
ncbi:MAG: 3-oxoacyl-ACP synthase III [Nannocystaceae bacterium]|nr:3-oxoacyl-ACP synthase III [Nannocystaceae bacterium]